MLPQMRNSLNIFTKYDDFVSGGGNSKIAEEE